MEKIIEILKYILIGFIQGVSEILPISSSAHLSIAYYYLNIDVSNQMQLTIFLHFASSLALLLFFKDIVITVIKGFIGYIFTRQAKYKDGYNLAMYLCVSTIPCVLISFLFKQYVESIFDNVLIICINLIITAICLLIYSKLSLVKTHPLNYKNTFIIGVFQSLAILPGISRSAMTLLASKFNNIETNTAKKFIFLLLLPISIGGSLLSFVDLINCPINNTYVSYYMLAMIVTFIITFLTLKYIFKHFNKISFKYYAYYLLIISFFIISNYK